MLLKLRGPHLTACWRGPNKQGKQPADAPRDAAAAGIAGAGGGGGKLSGEETSCTSSELALPTEGLTRPEPDCELQLGADRKQTGVVCRAAPGLP